MEVRGPSALAGDLTAFFGVHAGKASTAASGFMLFLRAVIIMGTPIRRLGVAVGPLAVLVGRGGVPASVFVLTDLVVSGGLAVMVRGSLVIVSGVMMMRGETALSSNLSHVLAVSTDGPPTLAPCLGRFLRVKLMGDTLGMGRPATGAGDFALFLGVHRRETPFARLGHWNLPSGLVSWDAIDVKWLGLMPVTSRMTSQFKCRRTRQRAFSSGAATGPLSARFSAGYVNSI
jgi:hypothetical protein